MIVTDGIYSRLDLEEMKFALDKNQSRELEAIDEMAKLANDRGNLDNQSALLLYF